MNKTWENKMKKINYYDSGRGEEIIFLHGWGQNYQSFNEAITVLEKTHHVYALDLPGFGQSEEPIFAYTIYDYEQMLEDFITEHKIKNPTIIAHSFGGRIAIIYASKNKNIKQIILTGGAGIKPTKTFKNKLAGYNYKFMRMLVNTIFYRHYADDLFAISGSADYRNASDVMKKVLINVVNEDLTYLLEKIMVPTLLYWGVNDDATPLKDGQLMDQLIPNSELIVKQNSGHYAFLENSPDFIQQIEKFLKK